MTSKRVLLVNPTRRSSSSCRQIHAGQCRVDFGQSKGHLMEEQGPLRANFAPAAHPACRHPSRHPPPAMLWNSNVTTSKLSATTKSPGAHKHPLLCLSAALSLSPRREGLQRLRCRAGLPGSSGGGVAGGRTLHVLPGVAAAGLPACEAAAELGEAALEGFQPRAVHPAGGLPADRLLTSARKSVRVPAPPAWFWAACRKFLWVSLGHQRGQVSR